MTAIDRLVDHATRHPRPVAGVPVRPRTGTVIVTCMDARIDVFAMFGLAPGDAHVLRGAGGCVTEQVIADLRLSRAALGTTETLLVHHEGCAAVADPEADLAGCLARLRTELSGSPTADADRLRGFVYRLDGTLREVAADAGRSDGSLRSGMPTG